MVSGQVVIEWRLGAVTVVQHPNRGQTDISAITTGYYDVTCRWIAAKINLSLVRWQIHTIYLETLRSDGLLTNDDSMELNFGFEA